MIESDEEWMERTSSSFVQHMSISHLWQRIEQRPPNSTAVFTCLRTNTANEKYWSRMSLAAGLPFDISSTGIEARLICSACHYLLVEPKFTSCGHRYCSVCLKKISTYRTDRFDDEIGNPIILCLFSSEGPTSCRVTNCNQIISKDGVDISGLRQADSWMCFPLDLSWSSDGKWIETSHWSCLS